MSLLSVKDDIFMDDVEYISVLLTHFADIKDINLR